MGQWRGMVSLLQRPICVLSIAVSAAAVSVPQGYGAYGQSEACSLTKAGSTYPNAIKAIASWQTSRNVYLSQGAANDVSTQFCNSAVQVSAQFGVTATQVNESAEAVVWRYLDESLRPGDAITPMADLVGRQFALGGMLSMPEPKRMGLINFKLQQKIDQILLDNEPRVPALRVMAPIGSVAISALASRNVVCQATVSVSTFAPADFLC